MTTFSNFIPGVNQQNVPRTTVVGFTMLDAYGVQINTLGVTIDGYQAILNGDFVGGHRGNILSSVGKYVIGIYPKKPFLSASAKIDIDISYFDSYADSYSYSFYTVGYNPTPPEPIPPSPTRPCLDGFPFFPPNEIGLSIVIDEGTGTEATLEWREAAPHDEDNIVAYNIYYDTNRGDVFDGYPDFLVTDTDTTIGGMAPGDMHFFGVRAGEHDPNVFTTDGMELAGSEMYHYPEFALVDGYVSSTAMIVPSSTTDGFPDHGVLAIDTELIRYSSKSSVGFLVYPDGRGYEGTFVNPHYDQTKISLYVGREEQNSKVCQAVPSFQKPNYALTYALRDGYQPDGYRDGYDGYAHHDGYLRFKQEPIDSITTNGEANDDSGTFPRLDYCGTYRALSPASFMQGQCRPSYFGGAQVRLDPDGNRHLVKETNVQNHLLQREELLLESSGEPFVLLRRMWTGMRCVCFMHRREHPDARCPLCYGTGFTVGFIQFFNPRRSDRRILVRVDPASDDLRIIDKGGLEPMHEPDGWTLPFPQIKDRDILIRFNPDNTEAWRYEVQYVTRNRTFFVNTGAQKLKLKRMPKTSIIYQFPTVRDTSPTPGSIYTSVDSTGGLKSHSHQIIIPEDANLLTLNAATLESEGHNHIIYKGQVYQNLNHTHTIG